MHGLSTKRSSSARKKASGMHTSLRSDHELPVSCASNRHSSRTTNDAAEVGSIAQTAGATPA
jgi:hypothetical protein